MQICSKLRQPVLYVAGLSVLFLLVVAACGGGNGDDEPPAPWPLLRRPLLRPHPASGRDPRGNSPDRSALVRLGDPVHHRQRNGTIAVELTAGDILELSFDVESMITGGQNVSAGIGKATEGIKLVIMTPWVLRW